MSHGGHRSHRGRGRGPGPRGLGDFFGPRGPRARRGDVRAALIALLAEEPRNGYQLMQEIERRSDGVWRPSPGSVYPALQLLEDEGLVGVVELDGRKAYELTDEGRTAAAARDEDSPAPWDAVKDDLGEGPRRLMTLLRAVAMAASQISSQGTAAQQAAGEEILKDTRRSLYRVLAEDEPADDAPADPPQDA